ncbi:hypothetical protein NDN08_003203 [Rhodosorus marinus]|uniref:Vacuolar protein sorting-associated protein 35 n=1 Tax=Rhodosorus marinus TaxID=101924 RepID=A0AAV8UXD9_9RHOD|nr:hypothetical protein NDN08_003203 [Rhodosorus marinus]
MSGGVRFELGLQKEALLGVSQTGMRLAEAIERGSLEEAVARAGEVAGQLRLDSVASLPIELYSDVHIAVGEELQVLQRWIALKRSTRFSEKALRKAQENAQIVPRLYVTVVVIGASCEINPPSAVYTYSDLMDLLTGVQDPIRGLFLRAFVTQHLRKSFSELGSAESIKLLIRNLIEMTRLWVRTSPKKGKKEARVLIGQTLSALGRLDLDTETYARTVLPRLTEMILSYSDPLAQEYIAECIVQVFSDELHLSTLDSLLGMCQGLSRGVRLRIVISALTERLGSFVLQSPENAKMADNAEAFQTLTSHLPAIEARMGDKLSVVDRIGIYLAVLRYTLKAEPERLENVDKVLVYALQAVPEEGFEQGSEQEELVGSALTEPLIANKSLAAALKLESYRELAARLSSQTRRIVAATMLKSVTQFSACLSDVEDMERLFELVGALVEDESAEDVDEDAQNLVARIVFLLDDSDPVRLFQFYQVLRKRLARGGSKKARITFPSLIIACLRLTVRLSSNEEEFLRVCQFSIETISALDESDPQLALKMYLEGVAAAASSVRLASQVMYDFAAHAIVLYEEHMSNHARLGYEMIVLILGAIGATATSFHDTDFKTLTNRLCKHSACLPDDLQRCIALCLCARTYWKASMLRREQDPSCSVLDKQVVHCLIKARSIATSRPSRQEKGTTLLEVFGTVSFLWESRCPLNYKEWVIDMHEEVQNCFGANDSKTALLTAHIERFNAQRFSRLSASIKDSEELSVPNGSLH